MSIMTCALTFAGSLCVSLVATPMVRKLAVSRGQVAVPKDTRWHSKETPLLGGVGIFFAAVCSWLVAAGLLDWGVYGRPYAAAVICAFAIFLLGLADDIFDMDPQHKLAGQIVITSVLMFFGFRLEWTDSATVNLFLSLLWVVGITNAFNLLDNMDGLAAGIAFIAGTFLFLCLFLNPDPGVPAEPVLVMVAAYLGALLGFLFYNFNPASIFMGDAGSLFIGFTLAVFTLMAAPPSMHGGGGEFLHLMSVIVVPLLILLIPILDTGLVSVMRKLFRRPISQGGRDHSSHRMVAIGFSEKKAVLILWGFSVASGLVALAVGHMSAGATIVMVVLYLLFVIFFWIHLGKVKVYPEESGAGARLPGVSTPILVDITYRKRLFEVLLDLVLITVAYYASYLLRFEGVLGDNFDFFLKSLPIMIACQIVSFHFFGVYRGVWERTGLTDLVVYIRAITAGTIMPMLILLFVYRFQSFSRAVFVTYWGLMLILVSLSRLSFRMFEEGIRKANQKGSPTLVYGAGVGGQMVVKELETNPGLNLAVAGFMDDNQRLHRSKIQGYTVLGGMNDLGRIIEQYAIECIIVSFKDTASEKKQELERRCADAGAEVSIRVMKLIIR